MPQDHPNGCACAGCADHDDAFHGPSNVPVAASQDADLPSWTLARIVDDIDNLSTWDGDSVTFSFPTEESPDYEGNWRSGDLRAFTADQAAATREVLALIGDLIDLEFVDAGTDVDGAIRMYNVERDGTAGGSPAGEGTSGDMWIYRYDADTIADRDHTPGGYEHHLLVHEMGHVLGLSHTSFSGGDSYAERAGYAENNHAYSVMSYLTAGSAGLDWATTFSGTMMLADVAALQSLYGANMATRTGDTTYGFGADAGRDAFDFDLQRAEHGAVAAVTIWDAGGHDTLDLSGFTQDGVIDLGAGAHSSVGGHEMNVAIAAGALIEDARAGIGDDEIIGNVADNALSGGLGADTLRGGEGADVLRGDDGNAPPAFGAVVLGGAEAVSFTADLDGATSYTVEALISFDPGMRAAQWFTDLPGDAALVFDAGNQGLWLRADGAWRFTGIGTEGIGDGAVHRLSVSVDAAENAVTLYLDGAFVSRIDDALADDFALTDGEAVAFDHDGALGDVRVFAGARTAAEVREGAFAEIGEADGLVAHATFGADGASGAIVGAGAEFGAADLGTQDDALYGEGGADVLIGGFGGDLLVGGAGDDVLWGDGMGDLAA